MEYIKNINFRHLRDFPQLLENASLWFSAKWNIPADEYRKSIADCILQKTGVPQWYVVLNGQQDIVAGAGVIENDFHNRKDLSPNVCALFVEEAYRRRGCARYLLDFIRRDLGKMGFSKLYLVTDHTELYEKCGWQFLTMVTGDDNFSQRMYVASTCL